MWLFDVADTRCRVNEDMSRSITPVVLLLTLFIFLKLNLCLRGCRLFQFFDVANRHFRQPEIPLKFKEIFLGQLMEP